MLPPTELITITKELTAATCVMQNCSNELNTLVSGKEKCKQTKVNTQGVINFRADLCRLLAEQYDTKSNIKMCGFQSHLEASCESRHSEEF